MIISTVPVLLFYTKTTTRKAKIMKNYSFLKVLIFLIISSACTCILAFLLGTFYIPSKNDFKTANSNTTQYTVIIDAGHGGEDGGASSVEGLIEKDVNLDIAKMLCDMLKKRGINAIMTREDDRLLYDRNVDYHGRKKKLDLAARLEIAKKTDNAILVSIHMNSFTDPKYSGLQVWYSQNFPESLILADLIQSKNRDMLQPDNKRTIKAANSAIRLLDQAPCPAVLVECGFLSNLEEAKKFESTEYKQQVAYIIFCSIIEFLNQDNSNTTQ